MKGTEEFRGILIIKINSFSYLKTGYPVDNTQHRGGFVFDMRGILNPGKFDEFKQLSGLDKPVRDFLEKETHMLEFLDSTYKIIDLTVANYLERGFESLSVNFGCTGGQHRSVYAAEALAEHLSRKFKASVRVDLDHLNRSDWPSSQPNSQVSQVSQGSQVFHVSEGDGAFYLYDGDPAEYDPENDYDALRIFENGVHVGLVKPESIPSDTRIYLQTSLKQEGRFVFKDSFKV